MLIVCLNAGVSAELKYLPMRNYREENPPWVRSFPSTLRKPLHQMIQTQSPTGESYFVLVCFEHSVCLVHSHTHAYAYN